MAFPEGLTLITVTGQLAGLPDGVPGAVAFRWPWLQGPTDQAVLAAGQLVVTTEADGTFTADVPATNDPGWSPSGFTLQVTIYRGTAVSRGRAALPYDGGAVDLAAVFNPDDAAEAGQTYALLASVTDLDVRVTALEEAPGGTAPSWESITGKPSVFPPDAHTQAISTITGLQTALDGLASTGSVAAVAADLADLDDRVTALEAAPGGSTMVVRRGSVTSGNLTLAASGPWVAVAGGPSLVLPAVVGDYVEFQLVSMLASFSTNFADLAVTAGGSLVRYLSTGGASPATEGAPLFYGDQSFDRYGLPFEFEVEAGDLSGATVTVVFATSGSGGGTIYANTDYPLRWRAINHGPADVA